MSLYFIYNNLKVNSFVLHDTPYPGFELLTWDMESWTFGTLWDLGDDAGYSRIGKSDVKGQVWICKNKEKENELNKFFGVEIGLTEPVEINVNIKTNDNIVVEEVKAKTFALTKIQKEYTIVNDGYWMIKRVNRQEKIL